MAEINLKATISAQDNSKPAFTSVSDSLKGVSDSVDKTTAATQKSAPSFLTMASAVAVGEAALQGLETAGRAALGFIEDTISVAAKTQDAMAQISNSIANAGKNAAITASGAEQLAQHLSSIEPASKNVVLATEQVALKFSSITSKEFPQVIQLAEDMSAKLGVDMPSAMQTLGRALQNPQLATRALATAGVTLTASLKDQLKQAQETGNVTQAQTMIIDALTKSMGGAAAAATDTWSGKMQILNNDVDNLKDTIGTSIITAITPFVTKLEAWASSPAVQKQIQSIATSIGDLITKMGDWIQNIAIPWVTEHWPAIQKGIDSVVKSLKPFIDNFKTIAEIMLPVVVAILAFVAPIPVVIALVGILAVQFALAWGNIKKSTEDMVNSVKNNFDNVKTAIAKVWDDVKKSADDVIDHIKQGWTNFKGDIAKILDDIKAFFSKYGLDILAVVAPVIGIPILIVKNWSTISAFFSKVWADVKTAFSTGIKDVLNFLEDLPSRLAYDLGYMAGAFVKFVTVDIPKFVTDFITWIINLHDKLHQEFLNLVDDIVNFIIALPGRIQVWLTNIYNMFITWITKTATDIHTGFDNMITDIINFFVNLPGRIDTALKNIWTSITSWFDKTKTDTTQKVQDTSDTVTSTVKSLPQRLADGLKDLWSKITGVLDDVRTKFGTWASDTIDDIVGFFAGLPKKISDAVSSALGKAGSAVSSLWNSVTKGFSAGVSGKASGGPVSAQTPYIVGENGPELFVPSTSGSIVPNGKLAGTGTTNVFNIMFYGDIKNTEDQTLENIGRIVGRNAFLASNGQAT